MISPITGNEMKLVHEKRALEYRKEEFQIVYHFYLCEESGEQFTDDQLDNLNLQQVYNQYRSKYGIPFVNEITTLRENYGLSAAKMSQVLGLGINIYRQYEAGEMPSVATGRLIKMAENPQEFLKLLEIGKNALEPGEYEKVQRKLQNVSVTESIADTYLFDWLFNNHTPNIFNGYCIPKISRIGQLVKFFASVNQPFTTGLNKLLFYTDFGYYKKTGFSITGITYQAIQRGPVPINYGAIYNKLYLDGYFKLEERNFGDFTGEQFLCNETITIDELEKYFSTSEIEMIDKVSTTLGKLSTRQLVEMSHEEIAWQGNVEDHTRINYNAGFDLKHID